MRGRETSELVAGIGLGSNLGDRAATLQSAIDALARTPSVRVLAVSPLYETAPVGPPQPDYLNAAVRIETSLEPEALLDVLLAIERAHGRERRVRWGPRTLDLDVLAILAGPAGTLLGVETARLEVPHPHLGERAFALAPLLDVLPELAPVYAPVLEAIGGAPPRARGSKTMVVPRVS
jgi:2-amino-4-hydroxy-6-hydroxymethyldihydropteridine diphosphokinase